jgi:AbrB family looped-hinge helix DNA binding protein
MKTLKKALKRSKELSPQRSLKPSPAQLAGHGKIYGTATIGARGQIVIPAKARQDFNLGTGAQLFIIGNKPAGMLGLVQAENLAALVDRMINHLTEMGADREIKDRV